LRAALAVFIAVFFAVVFIISFIALRTVDTVSSPDRVAGIIEGSGAYDFAYDEVLVAAVADFTEYGFEFEGGPSEGTNRITFSDPDAAAAAIRSGIDTLAGKEYVREQVREVLRQMLPNMTGRTDSFELQLETADRIRTAPEVVRTINEEVNFGEIVTSQLIAPSVADLSRDLTLGPFGIAISEDEANDAARRIVPPEWVNEVIYEAVDQMAPYLAGDADSFAINIPLRDRVMVVADILKEQVADESTAGSLVISKIAGPLITQTTGESNVVGFGVEITDEDIEQALAEVAPPEWVAEQANNVIDTLIAYLTGESDSLEIVLDLTDRKDDAVVAVTNLAETKLREQIRNLPECQTPQQLGQAIVDISSQRFPDCAPQGSEATVPLMMPYVENEVEELIYENMPDTFVYTDAEFRSGLGEEQAQTLDDVRTLVIEGITFTEKDLVNTLAGDAETRSPEDLASFEETLNDIRSGFSFTDTSLQERMGEDFEQVSQYRDQIGLAYSLRYLLYLLPLGLLGLVGFVGSNGWRGRGMWSGMTLFAVSIVLLLVFVIAAAVGPSRIESLVGEAFEATEGVRQDFPSVAALLDGGRMQQIVLDTITTVVNVYRDGIIPFVIAGGLLFVAAMAYPKYSGALRKRPAEVPAGEPGDTPGSDHQSSDSV
jgi:hypothetical protein